MDDEKPIGVCTAFTQLSQLRCFAHQAFVPLVGPSGFPDLAPHVRMRAGAERHPLLTFPRR